MQLLPGEPAMLVDGAHNPAGMAAMVASARELFAGRRVVAVFAAMRDKDVAAMAATLQQLTKDVVVTAPDVQRAADPAQLASHFDAAHINPDVATAIAVARERAGPAGVVVVCGSLFLVAEALRAPQP